ncbi:coiled-coil domain-containing protein 15 isoform X2 [Antennarius striatus]|uniref:coiled-coil domain-containing protein 15 isoform X2 n=1 Tax=Antennarius striatus TaxID=241820 RepID=UPI0035B2E3BB
MSANALGPSSRGRHTELGGRRKGHMACRAVDVLAGRNLAVVAVGAWVEGGQHFLDHPCILASLTEEIQAIKRKENEENLERFQDEVRRRVTHQAQVNKMRQQLMMKPDSWIPLQPNQAESGGERLMSSGASQHTASPESREGMKQVRLRLAACQMIQLEGMKANLPGGEWNFCPTRHNVGAHMARTDPEVEEEDDGHLSSHHKYPLVQQKFSSPVLQESDKSQPEPGLQPNVSIPRILWPLSDPEEAKKQHQSQFLMHRRRHMNIEREQVKENRKHRKHLQRSARIKAEKEQLRLREERRLERVHHLTEARQRLEERDMLILEKLKLEEEEEKVAELQLKKNEHEGKEATRFVEALRAQVKERLSQEKLELPPLCYCASSFWDSHPDTCANNCVFHNNPKEYAKALHSTMMSLDLQ